VAQEILAQGGSAIVLPGDVTDLDAMQRLVREIEAVWEGLDMLVANAGNYVESRPEEFDSAEYLALMSVNYGGMLHCMQAVLPRMREQKGGLIIHISSISGLWGDFSGAAYQASKHGLTGLANAMMMEERLNGIRVTIIYPGLCDTPILKNRAVPPTQEQRALMMQPEDIAQACVFAASLPPRTYVSDLVLMPGALQCNGHPVG
jgi:NADP-dependent 3-hydroxy acid dehydrogenase YdfG